jgi:hypothetical protein
MPMTHNETSPSDRNNTLTEAEELTNLSTKRKSFGVATMLSQSDRMNRISVIYALWGLFFASLSAGLIVASHPAFRTIVVVDNTEPAVMNLKSVNFLRGSRRLFETSNEVRPYCTYL